MKIKKRKCAFVCVCVLAAFFLEFPNHLPFYADTHTHAHNPFYIDNWNNCIIGVCHSNSLVSINECNSALFGTLKSNFLN